MATYADQIAAWQKAYPYLGAHPTSGHAPTLGDYEDAYRKFSATYAAANPFAGATSNTNSAAAWVSGNDAEAQNSVQSEADWSKYWQDMSAAFNKLLTPEQAAQWHQMKVADQAKKQRMGQMAFLGAVGAMAAPGLIGALGSGGSGAAGVGTLGGLPELPAGLVGAFEPAGGFAAIPEIGGAVGGGGAALGGGSGMLGTEFLGGLGQFGGLTGAGGAAGGAAAGGGGVLGQIANALGGSGMNWTNLLGNLGSGLIQSYTSGKAADAQLQAGQQANALLREMWQQTRTDQAPWRDAGAGALASIQALLKDPSSVSRMPDYQFGLDEGAKALANSAAARGMTYSGQQGKALQKWGQDYAGSKLNESYNRLAGLAGIGQQATNQLGALGANYANNLANNIENQGNVQGSGYVGQGNAWNQAIGGALNGLSEQALIDALLKRGP